MKRKAISGKDLYFVAVKVFLRRGGKLLILKDSFGAWDLPGGRLLPREFKTPLPKVISRKIKEELGPIKYALGQPAVFLRHERLEHTPSGKVPVRIFAVGYEARYIDGEIQLSSRHPTMEWVDLKNFRPESYFKGGWLRGVREYLAARKK